MVGREVPDDTLLSWCWWSHWGGVAIPALLPCCCLDFEMRVRFLLAPIFLFGLLWLRWTIDRSFFEGKLYLFAASSFLLSETWRTLRFHKDLRTYFKLLLTSYINANLWKLYRWCRLLKSPSQSQDLFGKPSIAIFSRNMFYSPQRVAAYKLATSLVIKSQVTLSQQLRCSAQTWWTSKFALM